MNFKLLNHPYDLRLKKIKFEQIDNKYKFRYYATNRKKIIGLIELCIDPVSYYQGTGSIDKLYVKEIYRRNGIATSLMNMALNTFYKNRIEEISLVASPYQNGLSLLQLIKFYESFGFEQTLPGDCIMYDCPMIKINKYK